MINIRIILTLFLATIGIFLLLRVQGQLQTAASPMGILSLEFAHTQERVTQISNAWETAQLMQRAKTNIWIDFMFIPFYAMLFYTLCGTISVRMRQFWAKLGILLAFGALVAGLCDAGENILMLLSLRGWVNDFTALLTSILAIIKFLLLGLAAAYVIPLGLRILLLKISGKDRIMPV